MKFSMLPNKMRCEPKCHNNTPMITFEEAALYTGIFQFSEQKVSYKNFKLLAC